MNRSKTTWLLLIALYIGTLFGSYHIQSARFAEVSELLAAKESVTLEFEIRSEPRQYLARFASDTESSQFSTNVRITKIDNFELSAPATILFTADNFEFFRGQTLTAKAELIKEIKDNRSCCLIKAVDEPKLVKPANWAFEFAQTIRAGLQESLAGRTPTGGALVPGLVLGDTSGQSSSLETAMRGSGLAHLTAASGGNVTIVLGLFIAVFSIFGLSNRGLVLVAALALAGYVLAVGFDASVMRAATMGSITLLAFVSKRTITTGWILITAVYLLTVFNPWLWRNWGFLLSVSATAGLIWFAPKIMQIIKWRKPFDLLGGLVAATMAATWVTAPLLALMTQSVPVVSIIANLIAAPLVAITTILGLLAALISLINPILATPLSYLAALPAELIGQVALRTSNLPGAQLELATPLGITMFVIAIVSVIGLLTTSRYKRATFFVVFGLVLSFPLLVIGFRQIDGWPAKNTFLIACDVEQGTAVLLLLNRNSALLFDTGGDPQLINQCLGRAGISEVSGVFISHFHADHAGGFAGVITGRKVKNVYVSPNPNPMAQSVQVNALAKTNGINIQVVTAPFTVTYGEYTISTLWPKSGEVPTNENDSSLILLISKPSPFGGQPIEFLFTGDIEPTGQEQLMRIAAPGVDVALVPHHGSRFQDPRFAKWTGARLGIISVGENTFGHPADDTISNWQQAGARVVRTDLNGDVAIVIEENGLKPTTR
ncbi:MAG: ComEC/Rec2 family competence protein [Actinobacteria bacterium]|nr:ComEC/Rec2 family competence protein [Actinomycetota bacterium]